MYWFRIPADIFDVLDNAFSDSALIGTPGTLPDGTGGELSYPSLYIVEAYIRPHNPKIDVRGSLIMASIDAFTIHAGYKERETGFAVWSEKWKDLGIRPDHYAKSRRQIRGMFLCVCMNRLSMGTHLYRRWCCYGLTALLGKWSCYIRSVAGRTWRGSGLSITIFISKRRMTLRYCSVNIKKSGINSSLGGITLSDLLCRRRVMPKCTCLFPIGGLAETKPTYYMCRFH